MLSILHQTSNLGVRNDLELFTIQPTQFSHEDFRYEEYQPVSQNFQNNEAIEFRIRHTAEYYLDPSSLQLHVKAKIAREDGTDTKALTVTTATTTAAEASKTTTTAATSVVEAPKITISPSDGDYVYPCDNFLNSLFEMCEVHLNDKPITHYELYSYRSFLDLLRTTNFAQKHTLWPMMYEPDEAGQTFNLSNLKDHGLMERYRRSQGSKIMDLSGPLFTDLAMQGKILPPGVTVRVVLKQNSDKFRLMTTQEENRAYRLNILEIKITAKFVKIAPSLALSQETMLKQQPAVYLLRGVETKYRSLQEGSKDIIFEDLCPRCVPSRITLIFVQTDAFYGNFKKNPYKFEHLDMERSMLSVGSRKYEEKYDFDQEIYTAAYATLLKNLNNEFIRFSRDQYIKNHFMLHYILTPDGDTSNLSPLTSENVRFTASLKKPLTDKYTCIIMTETPRVLEIDARRNISVRDPTYNETS